MFRLLEAHGYHKVVVVIDADDNDHRLVLQSLGFKHAVAFQGIKRKNNAWTDVELWLKTLSEPLLPMHVGLLQPEMSIAADLPNSWLDARVDDAQLSLRPATYSDAEAIRQIYRPYVERSIVSSEHTCPTVDEIRQRMGNFEMPWVVAVDSDGLIVGFCYASKFWDYDLIAMCSIYISPRGQGQGLGQRLYQEMLGILEAKGYISLIVAMDPNNDATIKLHEKVGFTHAGIMEEIGFKFGRWLPRLFMQRHLTKPKPGYHTLN